MTVLPIVGRELAVAARRPGTYWLRFCVAAGALALFCVPWVFSDVPISEFGQGIFEFLGGVMLFFSILCGVFLTADSLSVEKREGTLGLLFLTDLKGYDVVLGKMASNSLHAFFGLLAVFPVLALPLMTGGLGVGEFWRTMLVLVVTMYFSLGIGMFVSATSHEGRQAMGRTFAIIVILDGVLPLLWLLQSQLTNRWRLDFLLWPNPVYAFIKGFDDSYLGMFGPPDFWTAMTTLFLLGTVCIFAASFLLPRSWQKSSAADPNRQRTGFRLFGKARRRRPPLGEKNPFLWLALGDHSGQSAMNRLLILLGLFWVIVMALSGDRTGMFASFGMMLAFGMHFAAKVLIASESGRRFHQDRQSGAMELLLVTPLPAEDILKGQQAALRKQFHRALWLISIVNLLTLIFMIATFLVEFSAGVPGYRRIVWEQITMASEVFLGSAVMLWLDASALIWLGMWRGLTAKKYPRSVVATWGQVMLPPWLAFFLFIFIGSIFLNGSGPGTAEFFILLWFGLGAVVDVLSITWARQNLFSRLRSVIAEGSDK
jgi:ABC-type transport system involved in multi-copper enzyme maturation permease subunit